MKYGFIGCGNMGGAIARALCQTTTDIMVTDRSGKAKALAEAMPEDAEAVEAVEEAAEEAVEEAAEETVADAE